MAELPEIRNDNSPPREAEDELHIETPVIDIQDLEHKPGPQTRVPKWTLSGAIQYDIPAGDQQTVTPRVDVSYRSDIYYSNDLRAVSSIQPAYALVNARLTYNNERLGFSIAGAVTNVFDQYYYTTITDQLESFGFLSASVGRRSASLKSTNSKPDSCTSLITSTGSTRRPFSRVPGSMCRRVWSTMP